MPNGENSLTISGAASVIAVLISAYSGHLAATSNASSQATKSRQDDLRFQFEQSIQASKNRQDDLKIQFEQSIQSTQRDLDLSRERTERFKFVNELVPNLLTEDPRKRDVTTALISGVLNKDEASELFVALQQSKSPDLAAAGNEGSQQLTQVSDRASDASQMEREAFEAMLRGEFAIARDLLKRADERFPGYHSVQEIYKYLDSNESQWTDPGFQKECFSAILVRWRWLAPEDLLAKMRDAIK